MPILTAPFVSPNGNDAREGKVFFSKTLTDDFLVDVDAMLLHIVPFPHNYSIIVEELLSALIFS